MPSKSVPGQAIALSRELAAATAQLHFSPPVLHVYRPLEYAWQAHEAYLRKHVQPCKVLLVGMNPGPFGMAQTGIPFGEVAMARDWLGINEPVSKPQEEHPKRPILGFNCTRSEVSGRRLWGWARDTFKTPDRFFAQFFVHNYCPLAFMDEGGRNLTPDKFPVRERGALAHPCDHALRALAELLQVEWIIGVGGFAEARIQQTLGNTGRKIGCVPHPSPASPAANRGWSSLMSEKLTSYGLL